MSSLVQLKKDLLKHANKDKAEFFPYFFKTGKGEYGEGDKFIGVVMPDQRKIAKQYQDLPLGDIKKLLASKIHEHRSVALLILVLKYQTGDDDAKKNIYNFYLNNLAGVNNWDLVDGSASYIVGNFLRNKPRAKLYQFARARNLWKKRIAIIATHEFIRYNDFTDTLKISKILLHDDHDLIHKAVGWMLREVGKRDQRVEESFLKKYNKVMPRTMLRYAIERFEEGERKAYLKK